jgi:large subunit ribosomal protein L10
MALKKSEKAATIESLHEKMGKATFVAAVSYGKLDANMEIELRKAMRNAKIDYKVVKNTLALRAAKGTVVENLSAHFAGPVAVAIGYGDVVANAKSVTEALKKAPGEILKIRGAVAEGSTLDAKGVEALSKMPGLKESRSMLLGMLLQPATRIVQIINAPGSSLARVIQAHADKADEGAKAA